MSATSGPTGSRRPGTRLVDSFAAAAEVLPSLGSRVLLTIGAKQLKHFAHLHDRLVLIARILPCVASLQQALAAGFTPDRLLCLRPPFSPRVQPGHPAANTGSTCW